MQALGPYHQLVNSGIDFGTLVSERNEEITSTQESSATKSSNITKTILNGRILRERKRSKCTKFQIKQEPEVYVS